MGVGVLYSQTQYEIDNKLAHEFLSDGHALGILQRYGMTEEDATEALEYLRVHLWIERSKVWRPFSERSERIQLGLSLGSIAAAVIAGGLIYYFWGWLTFAATGMKVCASLWLG